MKTKALVQKTETMAHRNIQRKPAFSKTQSQPFFQTQSQVAHQQGCHTVQTKLKMGQAGDKYERQADAVADHVVNGKSNQDQFLASQIISVNDQKSAQDSSQSLAKKSRRVKENAGMQDKAEEEELQAKELELQEMETSLEDNADEELQQQQTEEEEEQEKPFDDNELQEKSMEEEEVATKPVMEDEEITTQKQVEEIQQQPNSDRGRKKSVADSRVEAKIKASKGRGKALPANTRNKMEQSFAADFSGIRIHTDDAAVLLSQQLKAQAFTHGRDIFFNQDKFTPENKQGEHLLAHELTHTVQQGAAPVDEIRLQEQVEEEKDSKIARQEELDLQPELEQNIQRKADDENSYLIRPELLNTIARSRGEIGTVNAKKTNADGTREGWKKLVDYFFTAFGDKMIIHEEVIKYKKILKDASGKKKDAMPSWCGIFVWWCFKQSGVPIADWKLGASIIGKVKQRAPGELPRKGDIAYRDQKYQHFALVSGVESPEQTAGKSFKSIKVATVNGNTAGDDNLGGQIQELWHPMSNWSGFFDPVANLDLPEVELVRTSIEPDLSEASDNEKLAEENKIATEEDQKTETEVAGTEAEVALEGEGEQISASSEADEVEVELPEPPAEPVMEKAAEVKTLDFKGSSDQTIVSLTDATPSQMAKSYPVLGKAVSDKLDTEKKQEANDAPVLTAKTSGTVEEGITSPDEIPIPGAEIDDGVKEPDPAKLQADEHKNHSPTPSNKDNEKLLDRQDGGGFLDWLRNNIKNFMAKVRTRDPGLNTSAGERKKVSLEGQANPNRMVTQRDDAQQQVTNQRDKLTDKFINHPGQKNIQPKELNEARKVEIGKTEPVTVETPEDPGMADYASAVLPEAIRNKADSMMQPQLTTNLQETRTKTTDAAKTRENDKAAEFKRAEAETAKLNKKADDDQRTIVIDNRKKVADEQKSSIKKAHDHVTVFNKDATSKQETSNKDIGDKTVDSETKAKAELEKGETQAEAEKKQGEIDAAAKKKELEKEQKNDSWWDRAKNLVKKAVKFVTEAIDTIFNKIREAVKKIIDTVKEAAIGLINAARDWIVDKLNKFRDWAKEQVNKYLADTFPGLAKAINESIDGFVDTAIAGVNFVADAAIEGVEALANAVAAALDKILSVMQTAMKAAVQIAGAVLTGDFVGALKIAIQTGCDIAGIDSKPIFDFFDRAGKQIISILKNPGSFFNNLMKAVGGGVRNFAKNAKKHLISGLIGWLTGALSEVAITLPEKFDVKGIFSLVMQILGLTYENIKARLIKRYPPAEKVINLLEKGFTIIKKLVTEGPIALWEEVKKSMANLKEMVLSGIRSFVITTVIKEAITWVLGLLNPAGALVKILKLLFDFVMFLVERFQQIKDFVMSVYGAITAIASGQLGGAMKAVENALARSLPVVIGLLASLAGLGGIGKTVQKIIKKVTSPINKLIDKLIDRAVKFVKKLLKKGKEKVKGAIAKFKDWWKVKKSFTADNGKNHSLQFKGSGKSSVLTIKSKEQPFEKFLTSLDQKGWDDAKITHYKKALATAKEIDIHKKTSVKAATKEAEAKKKADKEKKTDKLLNKLAKSTQHIFTEARPEWSDPEITTKSVPSGDAMGLTMGIVNLTKEGAKGKGSAPTKKAHGTYDILDQRKKGGGSYYIRGHLLNDNLGGKGIWQNMTPLTRTGNSQHEKGAESFVKAAVSSGAIMDYEVNVSYPGSRGKGALKDKMTKDRPTEAGILHKIVDAEDLVPDAMQISASRKVEKGGKLEKVETKTWNPQNNLDQSIGAYALSAVPKSVPVDINSLTSTAPLVAQAKQYDLTEMTANAQGIFLAVKARRDAKDKDPSKPMYGGYKVLVEDVGGSLKADPSIAKKWNEKGFIIFR